MTEWEWRNGGNLFIALCWVRERISERKLRLLGCACCRAAADTMTPEAVLKAIDVAERFADRLAKEEERRRMWNQASKNMLDAGTQLEEAPVGWRATVEGQLRIAALTSAVLAPSKEVARFGCPLIQAVADLWLPVAQELLFDIVGDPFHPVPSEVLASVQEDNAALAIAGEIYQERRFAEMPILADALEDAGCTHQAILDHCRQPGAVHVRGCWVLDLLRSVG